MDVEEKEKEEKNNFLNYNNIFAIEKNGREQKMQSLVFFR